MEKYIPGVCNIGIPEINRRKRIGWIGLFLVLFLFIYLNYGHYNPWLRLIIFFPATLSASGFLQAHFHFCSGFARKSVFNFSEIGKTQKIEDEAAILMDQKKGNQITFYAAVIGIVATLLCFII